MKIARKKRGRIFKELRIYFAVILLLAVLGAAFHAVLRQALLKNFEEVGTALARSYVSEESNNLTVYETLLNFGAESINVRVEEGLSADEIEEFLGMYYERLQTVLGEGTVDPYAVLDGRIIAANPWEGDTTYDFTSTDWYQSALAADGKAIFTNAYIDSITGNPVITIAQKYSRTTDAVLAFDIFPENFQIHGNAVSLPEGASFYVCDGAGTLLYAQSEVSHNREELQAYMDTILPDIRSGVLDKYDAYVEDLTGQRRTVYYYNMSNGWIGVITVPFDTVLEQLNWFSMLVGLVMLLCLAGILVFAWRDLKLYAQVERTGETVRVLGNTYYALYRIDYQAETYEMIKGSDFVRGKIPQKGPYSLLLDATSQVIEEKTFREFRKSFSTESIRELVSKRVRDFGGDFLRRFGDEYRWVSVRVLFDESLAPEEVVLCFREVDREKQRQLLDLVNDILDMSRMEQGKVILNNQTFDLRQCIEECTATFRLQADAEKKNFHVDYALHSSTVLGDASRFGQVMNNLLSNAFKFTSEGDSVSVSVKQFEDKTYSQYQIIVKDTGIGMSEEFLKHIFEPYARETTFCSKQVVGTGLGMPIVKNLVTQMSGQIHVDSALGKGTTFTITVPFTVVREEKKAAVSGKEQDQRGAFSLNVKCILLAEDNMVNMEIATEILSMNGLEIIQAWNGKEALDKFRDSHPFQIDAVLMDMQMPQMDGCEATRQIRSLARPDAKTVPIIAVTANAFAEDIAATTAAGMDAHVSKPIDFQILCKTLEELTMKKKQ